MIAMHPGLTTVGLPLKITCYVMIAKWSADTGGAAVELGSIRAMRSVGECGKTAKPGETRTNAGEILTQQLVAASYRGQ
jgi:hypothetical protein